MLLLNLQPSKKIIATILLLAAVVSTSPIAYSDASLAEIDTLRARGLPEAEISSLQPRLSSPAPVPFAYPTAVEGPTTLAQFFQRFGKRDNERFRKTGESRERAVKRVEGLKEGMVVTGRMGGGLKIRV